MCIRDRVRTARVEGVVVVDMTNRRSVARFGYPAGLVHGSTWAEVRRVLSDLPVTVEAMHPGSHLPEPFWRMASTPARAAMVCSLDRVLQRILGRVLARSWTFVLRREAPVIGQADRKWSP